MKRLIIFNLFVIITITALSQIKGVVYEQVNQNKNPIAGVNIYWQGTNIGTVSDKNGKYEIVKVPNSDTLVFSFVGYQTKKMFVKSKDLNIDVELKAGEVLSEIYVVERQASTFYSKMETGNIQNISGAELCKAACCNLSESFETNASVDANYNDAITGAKQIKLLGLAGKYVQIMTENFPNFYGLSQPYALTYIPGTWMESIQVSKGASTVINGYESITGQINVEYKKPGNSDDVFFNQFISSAGKSETNFNARYKLNEKLSTMIFAHIGKDFLIIDHDNDGFADLPLIDQYNFFNRWDLFHNNFTFRGGIKFITEERRGGQTSHVFNNDFVNSPFYGILIKTQRLEAFSKTGYVFPNNKNNSLAMMINYIFHNQESYYGRKDFNALQQSFYSNIIWQSAFDTNLEHKYNTGISFKFENLTQNLNDSSFNIIGEKDIEIVPGTYFQYTGHLFEKISLIAGIRGDYHNNYGFLITPRINVKYNLTGNVIWKFSAGKAYRTPYVYAENSFLFASARNIIVTGQLGLEEALNYGSSLTFYIPIGKRDMTLQTEVYRTDFINQVVVDFETPRQVKFYALDGKSFSNVFQTEAYYTLFEGFDLTLAFRYNDVKQTIAGSLQEVPLTSRYKGLVNFSYKTPMERWQFDFTAQFNGPGRIPKIHINDDFSTNFPSYTILNAQITKYFKYWEIYTGCENITNFTQNHPIISADMPFSEDFDSSLIWGPVHGRKLYIGIRFAFNKKSFNS